MPILPNSPDGVEELRALDVAIESQRIGPPTTLAAALIQRATLRGRLEDYVEALALSATLVEAAPADPVAWATRVRALTLVHRFADARAALERLHAIATDPDEVDGLAAAIDEATGHADRASAYRERIAKLWPHPKNLVAKANNLAARGRLDLAIASIPETATAIHDNSAVLIARLLYQWASFHIQNNEHAVARELLAEAHARVPGYLDVVVLLAQAMHATGEDPTELLTEAVRTEPHPELLALLGKRVEATAAWDRYLAALPEAFADHGARYFLNLGGDPERAVALARANFANRDTFEARALMVDTALAARDAARACAVAEPLATSTRAHQFTAWRAYAACGRKPDADALAKALGIE